MQDLVDDALAGECSISMNMDRNNRVFLVVRHEVLLGTNSALDYTVDDFKVGWVREERDLDRCLLGAVEAVECRAHVVFDITRLLMKFLLVHLRYYALELCEDYILGLLDNVC